MIQNVGPGRGSVSYLPISQDVLEIRDESGRLLRSLFAPDEARAAAQALG